MHLFIDILRNSVLITGLVVVMMMMIESLNIESKGMLFKGLRRTKTGQVVIGALLGSIPGCMGGFATVSLYTHRMFSFGALVAMMIASSGDESFVMLAMIPDQALILFAVLFVVAVIVGIVTDKVYEKMHAKRCEKHDHAECGADTDCHDGYVVHTVSECCDESSFPTSHDDDSETSHNHKRHYGLKRIVMFIGLAVFIAALASGQLGHDHSAHEVHAHHEHPSVPSGLTGQNDKGDVPFISEGTDGAECGEHCHHHDHGLHEHHSHAVEAESEGGAFHIDLLSEDWMNVLFAGLSMIVLFVLLFASDHFVEEHLWNHIVKRHLPTIFAWTFGVLLVLGIGLQFVEIDRWISDNVALMILLATMIGIIPESGPHMIFVTLFAAGVVPFPVLLASSISQDGHASIPLLAESKKSFLWAKTINCAVALMAGYGAMIMM
ncbi:MAG: arsenic efflux protein [Bacteroidales bacterium]|nr:arsenic efflux protein [Bacteroidales bacterium]